MAWAVDDEPPSLWLPGEDKPKRFFDLIDQGATVAAWNSFFELCIWELVLGWRSIPWAQWADTAALAAAQAYPRALGDCSKFVGLDEDEAKDKRGLYLIQRLCKPYRGKRMDDYGLLQELHNYCLQDVIAERAIRKKLRPLSAFERKVWECDQRMNWRGVRLDACNCWNAIAIIDQLENEMNEEVGKLTDGAMNSTRSRAKSLEWVQSQGFDLQSYDKTAIANALSTVREPKVKRFLEIRQALSKSSTKKYRAMIDCLGKDGRAHGTTMYCAAATGRWGGKHFQPQNLPRPTIKNVDAVIDLLDERDHEQLPGEPMSALASCLRGMLIASDEHRLIVSDYSAIEARVIAWLAGHTTVLQSFRDGLDLYKVTASAMQGIPYDRVTDDQRFLGKVASLALSYQGGSKAFTSMAKIYGSTIDERIATKVRDDWRGANKPIVQLWADIEKAARKAIQNGGIEKTRAGDFKMIRNDLLFKLPSGRLLTFPKAAIKEGKITYVGKNNYTHKYEEIQTFGGSITQSITQAVARDLLANALLKLEEAGYRPILTVHDEVIADTPIGHGSLQEFNELMCDLPAWAKGLPVEAEGYESPRYRK